MTSYDRVAVTFQASPWSSAQSAIKGRSRTSSENSLNKPAGNWNRVYDVVNSIESGYVATYGQVAAIVGMPGAARQVGWALAALAQESDVPWHRVINAQGEISPRGGPQIVDMQRALLESEGIEFNARGRIDLECYAWVPGRRKALSRTAGQKTANKKARKTTQKTAGQKVSKKAHKKARKKAPKPAGKAAPRQRGSNR
jgi:methylated-DNA-protein-cysteine methyltransferase-like protein